MLKLENSIRGLSFSRVAFDLTIQDTKNGLVETSPSSMLRKDIPQLILL